MCADTFWRVAKAGTEKPVEVRNIGKAACKAMSKIRHDLALCGKKRERVFQPQLGDVCGEGCPRRLKQPLQIRVEMRMVCATFDRLSSGLKSAKLNGRGQR